MALSEQLKSIDIFARSGSDPTSPGIKVLSNGTVNSAFDPT